MKKLLLIFLLITQSAFADYITQNIVDGCTDNYIAPDNNYHSDMMAEFTINQHTCTSGEFLPANIDECRTCPSGQTCTGGTFDFNENMSQGISLPAYFTQSQNNSCIKDFIEIDNNNHADMVAEFTPNTHTCGAGYYLPADVDACTICPANNVCVGGTFTYNETTDQGIVACVAPTPYAPIGSDSVCYPHILHVGADNVYLRSTKQTTPSLNIQIGNDIFYANMTTVPTYMNKDSTHYLHILYEGDDYYVCDDTTYTQ